MAVHRVEVASPAPEEAVAEPVWLEARAHKVGEWWRVDVDVGDKSITVQVSSLDDVDEAVNRLMCRRPRAPHPPARVHIYWYH